MHCCNNKPKSIRLLTRSMTSISLLPSNFFFQLVIEKTNMRECVIIKIFIDRTHTFIDDYCVHKISSSEVSLFTFKFSSIDHGILCFVALNKRAFFLSLWYCAISSCFTETPVKDRTCPTFSPCSWSLFENGISYGSRNKQRLYWAAVLVNISIRVSRVFISTISCHT